MATTRASFVAASPRPYLPTAAVGVPLAAVPLRAMRVLLCLCCVLTSRRSGLARWFRQSLCLRGGRPPGLLNQWALRVRPSRSTSVQTVFVHDPHSIIFRRFNSTKFTLPSVSHLDSNAPRVDRIVLFQIMSIVLAATQVGCRTGTVCHRYSARCVQIWCIPVCFPLGRCCCWGCPAPAVWT